MHLLALYNLIMVYRGALKLRLYTFLCGKIYGMTAVKLGT